MPEKTAVLRNICPVDLHPLPAVHASSADTVMQVVADARRAQVEWDALGFDGRVRALKKATKEILQRRQEVLELLHDEAGKTPADVLMGEALGALQYVKDWEGVARRELKPKRLKMSPVAFPKKRGTVERIPRGVVAVIAPWNFPLANFFKPVFAALLCGNSVVLKPSELSPRTGAWFVELMGRHLPPNVLCVVQGGASVGDTLVRSGVDAVTFTGSSESGRKVAKACAEALIPVSLELGGKDAAIVLNDCDFERTVAGVMYWSIANAGQSCGAIERVYVEDGIADRFVDALATATSRLRITSESRTSDVAPMANKRQLEVVESHVKQAISDGAKLLCGGSRTQDGLWFQPTVLDHCKPSMTVMREPTFGPVIAIARVPSAEAAILAANDCDYGLNGSIWSSNISRAEQLAKHLQVGTAYVNNHGFTGAMPEAPWTGVKKTGYGIANSKFALNHYTRPRTVVVDTNTGADAWWFPMDSILEELGHRLAEAQVGNALAAIKVPWLIMKRQKAVLDFVRSGARSERPNENPSSLRMMATQQIGQLMRQIEALAPPLTAKERDFGAAAMETIFTGEAHAKNRIDPLPKDSGAEFIADAYQHMPWMGRIGLRAAVNFVGGLGPLFTQGKLQTLDQLPPNERLEVMERLWKSDFYPVRQLTLLMKATGALAHASTTRYQREMSVTPNVAAPKTELRS